MALRGLFICYGGTKVISVWARRHKRTEENQSRQRVIPVAGTLETRVAIVSPEALTDKLSPEARAHLAAREKTTTEVLKFAQDDPAAASKLLRVWLVGQHEKSSG